MGNSSSSASEVDSYNHPRLGIIKRIQQFNSRQYIGYEIVIQNQKIYDEWVKELRFINSQQPVDQILFLPLDYTFKQTAYCGNGGLASLRFEDYLYSLLAEIVNRRQIKRPFNEQELLYLFYSLVKASSILEHKNRAIGDVKPENILVNEDGYIKIISQFSWPGQPNKFVRGWEKGQQRLLLSPQECEQRHKKKQAIAFSAQDSCSQAFSIGLTILEAGTLRDSSEIYGSTYQYKFNEVKVRQFLDIFESRYSKEFSQIVRQMLHPNPKRRWKSQHIYKILKPCQYQIMNLQEILIKLDNSLFIPRIERQEKISIKKMGESHNSRLDQLSQSQNQEIHTKNSHISDVSPQGMQILVNSQPLNVPPYISSIHFARESNNSHRPGGANINGSTYYPEQPQNYHIVNEHTNFGRTLVPQPFYPTVLKPTHNMASSLPLKLSQHNQSIGQYITQNSMIAAIGQTQDMEYSSGNPRQLSNYRLQND